MYMHNEMHYVQKQYALISARRGRFGPPIVHPVAIAPPSLLTASCFAIALLWGCFLSFNMYPYWYYLHGAGGRPNRQY